MPSLFDLGPSIYDRVEHAFAGRFPEGVKVRYDHVIASVEFLWVSVGKRKAEVQQRVPISWIEDSASIEKAVERVCSAFVRKMGGKQEEKANEQQPRIARASRVEAEQQGDRHDESGQVSLF